MHTVDYIIVGQGLAGSAVAVQLLNRGRKILVIDDAIHNSSSRVAAGLFNPVTGKKMVKTWMADMLFPYLHDFYKQEETRAEEKFFFPMPLYRPFLSIEEQNEWMARSAEPAYAGYIETIFSAPAFAQVRDPFGGLLLKQCGYLSTTRYVNAIKKRIEDGGMIWNEHLDEQSLQVEDDAVTYKNVQAKKIIYCSGVDASRWFNWLPIRPLKGETILVKAPFRENIIVNRGVYFVPGLNPGEWRVGATYNFHDHDPGITAGAKVELEEKLTELMDLPYEWKSQEWGTRPTTPDRRPILGAHPEHPSVIIFNGLGTKGVSLTPYFSEVLVRWMENGISLNKLVDIDRYKSVYWTSPK
ncbi:NAD(P)/FAD-dependent oxidoreductase [Ohtaekwangia sp.]|uniref:NAD(P)/FAD-dependent oxidoreductase n=1 Tax=Ohtaekwangia sp. TaxID=2066019 RepID=UPI002F9463BB